MERLRHPHEAPTRILRLDAAGPEPANTLVHLTCRVPGVDEVGVYGAASRFELEFVTQFVVAGYDQRLADWYRDITQVSATAMFRALQATADLIFTIALDTIEPFVRESDGRLGFVLRLASLIDDEAIFPEGGNVFVMGGTVSAWVLTWEPPLDRRPAPGLQRTRWADLDPREALAPRGGWRGKASDLLASRATLEPPPGRRGGPC